MAEDAGLEPDAPKRTHRLANEPTAFVVHLPNGTRPGTRTLKAAGFEPAGSAVRHDASRAYVYNNGTRDWIRTSTVYYLKVTPPAVGLHGHSYNMVRREGFEPTLYWF